MADWNTGRYFNRTTKDGGFVFNTDQDLYILSVNDGFVLSDNLTNIIVRMVLSEPKLAFTDKWNLSALYTKNDLEFMQASDNISVSLLFALTDQLNITDTISDLAVLAFINEKFNILDQLQALANILAEEKVNLKEVTDIQTLLYTLDNFGLSDLKAALSILYAIHDRFGMTDREPKSAISDFMIGAIDNDDRAYDWLIPFGLKIDWNNTKVQVMPEAQLTTIEMPGTDGSIVAGSNYKDRLFEIVAFSEQGLSTNQKEQLKSQITRILDATKHQEKKLTVLATSTAFDVRYSGEAEITSPSSYVKVKIPLHTPPYGYDLFDNELYGSGLIENQGDTGLRVVTTIAGAINNPTFTMGTITYRYNGVIPGGYSLVIDHDMQTCYLVDDKGRKTNALANLVGDFQEIPTNDSIVLSADEATSEHLKTAWKNKRLW